MGHSLNTVTLIEQNSPCWADPVSALAIASERFWLLEPKPLWP